MRILNQLEGYDDNLTIAELKSQLKSIAEKEKIKEEEDFKSISGEFKNAHLKRIYQCPLYGKTLEVYYFEGLISKERTTEWILIYGVKGNKISFSRRDVNYRSLSNDKFSEKDLRKMEIITEQEYIEYMSRYNDISEQLEQLIS